MQTIAVVALKGGSGKTTLALHLAIAAHLRGHSVTLADADPQRSASDAMKARGGPGPRLVETSAAKLFTLQEASRRAGQELLFVDTPCGPEHEVSHAIGQADRVLIIVRPSFFDMAAALRTIEACRRLQRSGQIIINQACAPRFGKEQSLVQEALEALRFTSTPVSSAIIRSRAAYQLAVSAGQSVEELGPSHAAAEIAALWDEISPLFVGEAERKRA